MKNMSLNGKIYSILGLAFLTAVVIGGFGYHGLTDMKQMIDNTNGHVMPRTINALSTQSALRRVTIAQYRLVQTDDKEEMLAIAKELETYNKDMLEWVGKGKAASTEARMKLWENIEKNYQAWWDLSLQVQKFAMENNDAHAAELNKKQLPVRREAEATLNEIVQGNVKMVEEDKAEVESLYNKTLMGLILVCVIGLAVASVLAIFTMRAISKSIAMVVQNLQEGSLQVTSASAQIASASEQLSQASAEQAASLEQTAASVEEMNSMIARNTDNAQSASNLSNKSSETSDGGKKVVERMIGSMGQIDRANSTIMDQVNDSNKQIAGIVKVIEQIAKKTQVINDIVNKTELLSFNASVEAARAGEHGKGFAVVAEEVGNLARMSGVAAEEIGALIENSVETVNKIVQETSDKVGRLIEDGKSAVEEGTRVAHECNEVLTEIVGNVQSVASMSGEISSASQEQARGISEITKAMTQLDQMTQQNAATSEECASAAEELSSQAESLKQTVAHLVRTIHGANADTQNTAVAQPSFQQSAPQKPAKVLTMKPARSRFAAAAGATTAVKRASGDTPDYDSAGFQDV